MRILFLTNFYPPYEQGGYEQNCFQVAQTLKQRGHKVFVLTSDYQSSEVRSDVFRILHTEVDWRKFRGTIGFFLNRERRLAKNLANFQRVLKETQPDVLFVWGMWNLTRELLRVAEHHLDFKTAYYISDYWPSLPDAYTLHWREPAANRVFAWPKRALAWAAMRRPASSPRQYQPRFENAVCASRAVRQQLVQSGVPLAEALVVHNGIDITPFLPFVRRSNAGTDRALAIVYAGRLVPEKGVHTAIQAIKKTVDANIPVTLTIVGQGPSQYVQSLRSLVQADGLHRSVTFRGWVPPMEMPALLSQFDVLVLPSAWEALSLVVQQAMVLGLVVLTTPVGGMPEIIDNGQNGLFFSTENANELSECLVTLARDPQLYARLSESSHRTAMSKFTIDRMTDELEAFLKHLVYES